jgi:hypothetical protein
MSQGTSRQTPPRSRVVTLCGERLPGPGHVCAFFDSRQEKYDMLASYFGDAIRAGDRIINVVDQARKDDHLTQLDRAHVPVREALARHQMEVLTSEETYLRDGVQDLEGMLDLLRGALESAHREGRCVRTCGEMNWIGRSSIPIERVLEYEAKVNQFVPTFDCTLVCLFDTADMSAALVSDILATHPFAIIKNRLRPNPYYVAPDEYLGMLRSRSNGSIFGST